MISYIMENTGLILRLLYVKKEEALSKEAALKAYHNIFKTACGKMICREMFHI